MPIEVIRDGKRQTLTALVGTRPSEEALASINGGDDDGLPESGPQTGQAASASAIGLSVQPLTPAIGRSLGLDATVQGLVIVAVDPSSDSATKGPAARRRDPLRQPRSDAHHGRSVAR